MRINTDQVARTLERGPRARLADRRRRGAPDRRGGGRGPRRARAEGFAGRDFFIDRPQLRLGRDERGEPHAVAVRRARASSRSACPRRAGQGGRRRARGAGRDPGPDNLLLVVTTRPEKDAWSSAWFKAFDKHGVVVQTLPVEIGRLPQWISARAARLGLRFEPGAAELLAERVEGNLLAAHQEIEKLALLRADGRADFERRSSAVANSAATTCSSSARRRSRATSRAHAADPRRPARGRRRAAARALGLCRDLRALADLRSGVAEQAFGAGRRAPRGAREARGGACCRPADRALVRRRGARRPAIQGPGGSGRWRRLDHAHRAGGRDGGRPVPAATLPAERIAACARLACSADVRPGPLRAPAHGPRTSRAARPRGRRIRAGRRPAAPCARRSRTPRRGSPCCAPPSATMTASGGRSRAAPPRPVLHGTDAGGAARRARRPADRPDHGHGRLCGHRPLASRRGPARARPRRDRAAPARVAARRGPRRPAPCGAARDGRASCRRLPPASCSAATTPSSTCRPAPCAP